MARIKGNPYDNDNSPALKEFVTKTEEEVTKEKKTGGDTPSKNNTPKTTKETTPKANEKTTKNNTSKKPAPKKDNPRKDNKPDTSENSQNLNGELQKDETGLNTPTEKKSPQNANYDHIMIPKNYDRVEKKYDHYYIPVELKQKMEEYSTDMRVGRIGKTHLSKSALATLLLMEGFKRLKLIDEDEEE